MNSENFHEYLQNPSKLHQVSYQELKSLVLQYPFSPNLRYLLMLKSMFDQHKDYDRNLTLAAMYTPDRAQLWKLVKQNSQLKAIRENYELNEEFLELKDLSTLEEIIENQTPEAESPAVPKEMKIGDIQPVLENLPDDDDDDHEMLRFLNEDEDLNFLEELLGEPDGVMGSTPLPESQNVELTGERNIDDLDTSHAPDEPEGELSSLEDLLETGQQVSEPENTAGSREAQPEDHESSHLVSADDFFGKKNRKGQEDLEEMPEDKKAPEAEKGPASASEAAPAPMPKNAFRSWRKEVQPAKASLLSGGLKSLTIKKNFDVEEDPDDDFEDDYPDEEAEHIAALSVQEDTEITSETLALVLEQQEHFEKAIAMYERLILQNPEKSSFFAAKIHNLQQKK